MIKSRTSIPPEQGLGIEMLEILHSYYLLQTLSDPAESDNALENMKRMKFIQLLADDIILRLCKFRDDNSMSLSFVQVVKALRKRVAKRGRVDGIETQIKEYKRLTHNLENHRNAYIAHLSKRDRNHLRPTLEIVKAILLALDITDKLSGDENSYRLFDIDLRRAVSETPA